MYVVSMLMVSLWIVGISSPRNPGAMIHLLLISAVALLLVKIFETPERRARDVRWPPWPTA
jgi:hypothetical protein